MNQNALEQMASLEPVEKEPEIDTYLALIYEHAMNQNAMQVVVSAIHAGEPNIEAYLALIYENAMNQNEI